MKTALIILDFINDLVHPKGKIAGSAEFIKENHVIPNANNSINFARKNNIPIVFVKVGFNVGYPECPKDSPIFSRARELNALQLNTWGTEFHDALDFKSNDFVIIKHRVSGFYATALEAYLRANEIQNLLIAGVSTDMAVQTTARDAHDRDYKITIISDACGAGSLELQENSLQMLQRIGAVIKSPQL